MFIRRVNPSCRLAIVESDSTGYGYAYKKFANQGYGELEQEFNVETVDLSRTRQVMREVPRPRYFKRGIWLSEDLFKVDFLVSLAKIKTHNMTTMSCCLKNFFGCLSVAEKWVYHPQIASVIADIHQVLKADLWLCEGKPALEGNGPVMGTPKDLGIMVAANNPVACDAFVSSLIGFRPEKVRHIVEAARCGVGDIQLSHADIRGYGGEKYPLSYVGLEQIVVTKTGLFIQDVGQRVAYFGHLLHQQKSTLQILRGVIKRLRRYFGAAPKA